MSISVYEQLNNLGLNVDRTTLQQVSQSILKRAEEKNAQYKVDKSQIFFQPRDIGVDMYNTNVDIKTANQIALNNSGLQIQLGQDTLSKINYLNLKAAENTQKSVEGKLTISLNETILNEKSIVINKNNKIVITEASKDKNGSNPFYKGELLAHKDKQKSEETTDEQTVITTSIFV